MEVKQIYTESFLRNFTYVISHGSEAYCVDPYNAKQITDYLDKKKLNLLGIINTHEHADHTLGNSDLQDATQAKIFAHEGARGKISHVDVFLKKGDLISFDMKSYLEIMDTPGHTFAHLCLKVCENDKIIGVVTGDTLFNAGVGNCHNGGDPQVLFETIKHQFFELADEVKVYPGHDYLDNNLGFTLSIEKSNDFARQLKNEIVPNEFKIIDMGTEKKMNTFFRLNNEEIQNHVKQTNEKEVFLELRVLRNKW